MINPEDEIIVDLRTSCTKEEAVAKMLGWMQGPLRLKYIKVNKHGVSADQLPHLYSFEHSLQQELSDIKETARSEFLEAATIYGALYDSDDSDEFEEAAAAELFSEKESALAKCDELIKKAAFYLSEIEDELLKGESSVLKIDLAETRLTGGDQISLKSLDIWAKQYGVRILETPEGIKENVPKLQEKGRRHDALSAELEEILENMNNPTASKVMAILRARAGQTSSCVTTNDGDAIRFDSSNGVRIVNLKALAERIRTWRKHRLNTG